MSREDEIAEAWREALNLLFDALRHVHGPSVRHMAIRRTVSGLTMTRDARHSVHIRESQTQRRRSVGVRRTR
jgi:hypothetical protein